MILPRGSRRTQKLATALSAVIAILVSLVGLRQADAQRVQVRVLSAIALRTVLEPLMPDFERTSGERVTIVYATTGAIGKLVEAGAPAELTILPRAMIDGLRAQGRIDPSSVTDLARSSVGVAVHKGAPHPNVRTVDDFKRTLLEAKSISYTDPSTGGAAGLWFTAVLERLGLTGAVKPKTVFPPQGGNGAEVVGNGGADLAIAQLVDVLAVPQAELAGLVPSELQDPASFTFSMAILTTAKEPQAAKALMQFLQRPASVAGLKAKGMDAGAPSVSAPAR